MKCTLRKVSEGIVATIDERPEFGMYCYDSLHDELNYFDESRGCYNTDHKIIASTIPNVGKELKGEVYIGINWVVNINEFKEERLNLKKQYDYTETETQVIIQL